MYLWNINALVQDLRENQVLESYKIRYYIFTACLYFSLGNLSKLDDMIFIFLGIYLCRITNQKGDNADFINRITCLGVPICIRIISFFLLLLAIAALIGGTYLVTSIGISYNDIFRKLALETIDPNPVFLKLLQSTKKLFTLIFFSSYYLMLWSYIKKVSKPNISAN